MRDEELANRVHRNLMEICAQFANSPGGEARRENGELLFAAPTPLPFLNGVIREASARDAASLIEEAKEFFFGLGRGFVVYTWPGDPELEEAVASAGFIPVLERYPEMVRREPLPELEADLRPVTTHAEATAYWDICDSAYPSLGFPEGLFAEAFSAQELLEEEHVWACLGYAGEEPVATASLYPAEGIGMVGWVASRPEARGRGLAAACTVRATNRAFELGLEAASLQASAMGEGLYRNLGYEDLFDYKLYGAMPEGG